MPTFEDFNGARDGGVVVDHSYDVFGLGYVLPVDESNEDFEVDILSDIPPGQLLADDSSALQHAELLEPLEIDGSTLKAMLTSPDVKQVYRPCSAKQKTSADTSPTTRLLSPVNVLNSQTMEEFEEGDIGHIDILHVEGGEKAGGIDEENESFSEVCQDSPLPELIQPSSELLQDMPLESIQTSEFHQDTPPELLQTSELQENNLPELNQSSELQQGSLPELNHSSELQQNSLPELNQSSESQQDSLMELNQSAELQQNSLPDFNQSAELQQNSLPDINQSSESQQDSLPDLCGSSELQQDSLPELNQSSELQQDSLPELSQADSGVGSLRASQENLVLQGEDKTEQEELLLALEDNGDLIDLADIAWSDQGNVYHISPYSSMLRKILLDVLTEGLGQDLSNFWTDSYLKTSILDRQKKFKKNFLS